MPKQSKPDQTQQPVDDANPSRSDIIFFFLYTAFLPAVGSAIIVEFLGFQYFALILPFATALFYLYLTSCGDPE